MFAEKGNNSNTIFLERNSATLLNRAEQDPTIFSSLQFNIYITFAVESYLRNDDCEK